jgi:hypothetical protein
MTCLLNKRCVFKLSHLTKVSQSSAACDYMLFAEILRDLRDLRDCGIYGTSGFAGTVLT